MSTTNNKKISKELLLFLKLVSFFKKIRHQNEEEQAHFFFVNDLYNIVPYKQCVVWTYDNGKIVLKNASGQVDVSQRSPYAQFITKHLKTLIDKEGLNDSDALERVFEEESYSKAVPLSISDYQGYDQNEIKEWVSPHSLCLFLRDEKSLLGGIWLERNAPFGGVETAMLDDIGDAYAYKLQSFRRSKPLFKKKSGGLGRYQKVVLGILLLACLFPVRHSATVEVEVVSEDIRAVSVPYNGQIDEVFISPNQIVKSGDTLFSLERTNLRNEYDLAVQELETARRKLEKTERESFADAAKKSDLKILREQIKLKQVEVDYASQKLGLSEVKASRDGIALFSDKNDLLGKPIEAGQQVMTLADPNKIELLLRIPSEGMIRVNRDVPVKFFLNIAPLTSHKAQLKTISYKPEKGVSGIMGYSARADINNIENIERIGLTGTGKVYGHRTVLIASLLRRPFIAVRNLLGL